MLPDTNPISKVCTLGVRGCGCANSASALQTEPEVTVSDETTVGYVSMTE